MKRLITALVLMPLVWAIIFLAPQAVLVLVVAVVATLCFVEYVGIVRAHGLPMSYFAAVPGFLFPAAQALTFLARPDAGWTFYTPHTTVTEPPEWISFWTASSLAGVILAIVVLSLLLRQANLSLVLPAAGAAMIGVFYIYGPWWSAISLHRISPHWLLFALAANWIGDSAAYFAGRSFGRNKLAPHISPGKSWEGAIAAWVATVLFAVTYLPQTVHVSYGAAAFLGAVVNPAGQIGDLVESALKRGANLKDSGNLLPGHGGWLDRLDSSLFTLPMTYLSVAIMRSLFPLAMC